MKNDVLNIIEHVIGRKGTIIEYLVNSLTLKPTLCCDYFILHI